MSALKKNDNKDVNLSHLSISSANTPTKLFKSTSIHIKKKTSSSPNNKQTNPVVEKNDKPIPEEPTKNFSNYFNNLQNQQRMNDKRANIKEFKKEVKMIIKDAKQSKIPFNFLIIINFVMNLRSNEGSK